MPSLLILLTLPSLAAPADDLAAQIAAACGPVYSLEELSFTFVVEVDGEQKARRSHRWWPAQGKVEITAGDQTVTLADVRQGAPSTVEDARWATVAPGVEPAAALDAWGGFVNDSYWLLAPCKVMDPGVKRAVTDEGALELRFEGVGLTPGDVYRLSADPETGRVTGWEYTLQSGREGSFTWSEHTQVGPLNLSLKRSSEGAVIRFEDVSAR